MNVERDIESFVNRIEFEYNTVVKVVDKNAQQDTSSRAYGGIVRSIKGKLQEHITEEIIKFAWVYSGGNLSDIDINSKKIKIPIKKEYVSMIEEKEVKDYIKKHIEDFYYKLSVDKQVFYNDDLIVGIECKAYTENAMLKRILVDFSLLKTQFPNMSCFLFQLESQLGGDYSELKTITYGSPATHTLMSYFPQVKLHVQTFIKGERKVDRPIHKYFKPLEKEQIKNAISLLSKEFKKYLL